MIVKVGIWWLRSLGWKLVVLLVSDFGMIVKVGILWLRLLGWKWVVLSVSDFGMIVKVRIRWLRYWWDGNWCMPAAPT